MKLTQGTQGIPGSSRKVQPATEEFGIVGMGVRQGAFVTPEVVRSMVSKASGGGAVESCVKGGFHVEGVESSGVSGVRSARRAEELMVRVRYAPGGGVSLVTMAQSSAESVHDLVGDEDLLFSVAVLGGEHQLVSIGRNITGHFFMMTVFSMDGTEEYQFTVCYDARLGGNDQHGKFGLARIVGRRDGSSPMTWPIYRRDDDTIDWRLTFSDAGSLYHRRNVENAKVSLRFGWETAYEEEIGGMHFLIGGGATKDQIKVLMSDFYLMKKHLFVNVMVPLMLAGANCRCRSGADTHYWLGRGECVNCIRSRGEVPLGVRRVGNMFELVGGDAVEAARVAFVDALRLFLLLAAPTPECAVLLFVRNPGFRGLGYARMAMRALLRELGICRRRELLGLLPSNVVGLILLHESYATEEMIINEGAYQDGVHYRYSPSDYEWLWEGEYPYMAYGPYKYTRVEGVDFRQGDGRLATEMAASLGGYDYLMGEGYVFRPLREGHLPLVYTGGYGKYSSPAEGRNYLGKSGHWGDEDCYKGEEGEGMAGYGREQYVDDVVWWTFDGDRVSMVVETVVSSGEGGMKDHEDPQYYAEGEGFFTQEDGWLGEKGEGGDRL